MIMEKADRGEKIRKTKGQGGRMVGEVARVLACFGVLELAACCCMKREKGGRAWEGWVGMEGLGVLYLGNRFL